MQNKSEFIQIIKDNESVIYKITRVYSNGSEEQKDLYQEVVYQLWKSFESFKRKSKISTWIYRVALNTCMNHSKKEKRKGKRVDLDFSTYNISDDYDIKKQEKLNTLYHHIRQLNIVEKGIVLLYLEGKNYEEISAISGFTKTNVATRLSRIKQKLKSQIIKS